MCTLDTYVHIASASCVYQIPTFSYNNIRTYMHKAYIYAYSVHYYNNIHHTLRYIHYVHIASAGGTPVMCINTYQLLAIKIYIHVHHTSTYVAKCPVCETTSTMCERSMCEGVYSRRHLMCRVHPCTGAQVSTSASHQGSSSPSFSSCVNNSRQSWMSMDFLPLTMDSFMLSWSTHSYQWVYVEEGWARHTHTHTHTHTSERIPVKRVHVTLALSGLSIFAEMHTNEKSRAQIRKLSAGLSGIRTENCKHKHRCTQFFRSPRIGLTLSGNNTQHVWGNSLHNAAVSVVSL